MENKMTTKTKSPPLSRRNVLIALSAAIPLSMVAGFVFAREARGDDDDHPHHMGMHHGRGHMHHYGDQDHHHGHGHYHGEDDDHYGGHYHGGPGHHHGAQGKKSGDMKK
jgi:hypothetical protein